jgi:hypothetical protein
MLWVNAQAQSVRAPDDAITATLIARSFPPFDADLLE